MTTQFHTIDKNMIAALRSLRNIAIQEQVNACLGSFVTSAKARYIELAVSGISEVFRIKPNLQEVVEYVNAFRRTPSGRALVAAGLDLVELFNGARATLFAGKEPTKFELVAENGKLLMREVKPAFKDALKAQPKTPRSTKKAQVADAVKKVRQTAAQRAAEIDAEHKIIAEVAGGKKAQPAKKAPVKKVNAPKTDAK